MELFYHNRRALQEKLEEARKAIPVEEDLVADLTEAAAFAEEEHASTAATLEHLLAAGEITWELLWTIFPPNALVYRYHRLVEQHQIMKLRDMRQTKLQVGKPKCWEFDCHIVVDDGDKFGLAYERFRMEIAEFTGARKITDLRLFPLQWHAKAEELRKAALEQGRRVTELTEPRVAQTSGPAMAEKRDARFKPHIYKFTSHGRAIIDPAGFRSSKSNAVFLPEVHRELSRSDLTDEQLILCTPVALGFSFGDKTWGMCYQRHEAPLMYTLG